MKRQRSLNDQMASVKRQIAALFNVQTLPQAVGIRIQEKIDTFVNTLVRDIMALDLAETLKPSEGEQAHGTTDEAHT